MPIVNRTEGECFDEFADHVRALVASTVAGAPYVHLKRTEREAVMGFFAGGPVGAH